MTRKEYNKWVAIRKATRLLKANGYTVEKSPRPESIAALNRLKWDRLFEMAGQLSNGSNTTTHVQ